LPYWAINKKLLLTRNNFYLPYIGKREQVLSYITALVATKSTHQEPGVRKPKSSLTLGNLKFKANFLAACLQIWK
jgi:hypothetical protein